MQLKKLTNDFHLYEAFKVEIQNRIDAEQRTVNTATETTAIFRSQGAIKALTRLLQLREELEGRKNGA